MEIYILEMIYIVDCFNVLRVGIVLEKTTDKKNTITRASLEKKLQESNIPRKTIEEILAILDENTVLQKSLNEEARKNSEFFNNMIGGFFRIDKDENYILVNKMYADIYGYKPEEMLQKGFNISKTWAIAEEKNLLLEEAKKKELRGIIINFRRKDGSIGSQELYIKAIFDEKGQFIGYDGYARDVTKRTESLNAEVEARRRAEFLVDLMSHDINNIDQGILMLLEYILMDKEFPQKYREPISMAVEQVNYATELIKNVKKLQMFLEEPIKLKTQDAYKAIIQASEAADRAFSYKQLEVKTGFGEDEVQVLADDFIKDLFFNLFHNSLKHSKGEKVEIEIETQPSIHEKMVEIHISDNGPGIPDEEKKRILQRRLGAKGSGIGLTIVNYLLDRYDGYVQVKNRVEGNQSSGSRFIIVLHRADV